MSFRIGNYSSKDLIKTLESMERLTPKKRRKIIDKIIFDDGVMSFLFMPNDVEKTVSVDYIKEFYNKMTTSQVINAIAGLLARTDPGDVDRTRATFLTSLCNMAIERNNSTLIDAEKMKKKDSLTSSQLRDISEAVEEINEDIVSIMKFIKKNAKYEARRLSDVTGLPVYVCRLGLTTIPEKKYIDKFKVGFYLNKFLTQVYSDVNEFGSFSTYDIEWDVFFKNLFGEDYLLEVCTFILLEGVGKIDKYKNSSEVKACWNSLTDFALKELNSAKKEDAQKMIELYIKRIERMFQNRAYDLRVDLTKIPELSYPKLAKVISDYAGKITDIVEKASAIVG